MRNVFQRAAEYQPLTPGERALLRLIEGLACAGLVAALPIVAAALSNTNVNWSNVLRAALAAAAVAILMALTKYTKAHGDPVLSDALGQVVTAGDQPAGHETVPVPHVPEGEMVEAAQPVEIGAPDRKSPG